MTLPTSDFTALSFFTALSWDGVISASPSGVRTVS